MMVLDTYDLKTHFYRGLFISRFATLEKSIDIYLAAEFSERGKIEGLSQIIIDRLTFENKRTALRTILDKKSIADGFKKTNSKSFPSGKFIEELRILQMHRNYFAHYHTSVNTAQPDSLISLIEFRDSRTILHYNQEKLFGLIERIDEAVAKLVKNTMTSS
jgi:hypothetical protein